MLIFEQVFHAEGIYLDGPNAWDRSQKGHFHGDLHG